MLYSQMKACGRVSYYFG